MWFRTFASLFALAIFLNRTFVNEIVETLNGYGAKVACTLYFIQSRPLNDIDWKELAWPPISWFVTTTALNDSCVEGRIKFAPFLGSRVACLHEQGSLGCVLLGKTHKAEDYVKSNMLYRKVNGRGDEFSDFAVRALLSGNEILAVDSHFTDAWINSRAFLVIDASTYPAKILIECYGDGFNASIPQAGWSMTKSIVSLLVGALLRSEPNVFPDGLQTNIPLEGTSSATLEQMLRMSDGMDWDEIYGPGMDPGHMLFHSNNTGYVKKQRTTPGTCFQYSSKTTNVITQYIRTKLGSDAANLNFPFNLLFRPINANSARMETDASKNFVGSSFSLMTPLDWTRLGVLIANEGVWPATGKRIIDLDYIRKLREPTKTSRGTYGLHIWLGGNAMDQHSDENDAECDKVYPTRVNPSRKWYQKLPKDSLLMTGFEGQYLLVVPKQKLIMLRLGASREKMPFWRRFEPADLFLPVLDHVLKLEETLSV